jgi:uncharacterized protein (DUF952 family)
MGFHIEINSILRSDEPYTLSRGSEHKFQKTGSRIFFDDIPIWLTRSDWTALAEIRIVEQRRTPAEVSGTFRALHVYSGEEQKALTVAFRRMFAGGTDPFIYLMLTPTDYDQAQKAGAWDPPSRKIDGFIHASPIDQLTRIANKYYAQYPEVRVVELRHEKIRSEILWEPATGGLYPHVYGPINMDAAESVRSFPRNEGKQFVINLS